MKPPTISTSATPAQPVASPSSRPSRLAHPALLLAIVTILLAYGLRVWHLGLQSFWWDEAYSTMVASRSLGAIVSALAVQDFHPPFHYFALHYWMRAVGETEFALRYLSVLAGVLTVAVAWTTAKRLFGAAAAPISTLVFGLSPYLWYYSQETRPFAFVPLFGMLALYFCARAMDDGRWQTWGAYTIAITLGFYDLYYALFLPFACGLWILARPKLVRTHFPRWLVATAAAFVLYLPWIPIFIERSTVWGSAFRPDNGPVKIVVWSWPEFLFGLPTLALYQQPGPAVLLGVAACITVAGFVVAWRLRHVRPGYLLSVLAFAVPLLTMAAISIIKPVFHPRYAIPAVFGLYLLFVGMMALLLRPGRLPRQAAGAFIAVVLLASAGFGFYHLVYDPAYWRDNYRAAYAWIKEAQRPGDTIIHNAIPPAWYYYHGPAPVTYFPTGPYTEANVANELNQITQNHQRLWYVEHLLIPNDPAGYIESQLQLHAKLVHERWYGAIRVQLWAIPHPDAFSVARLTPTKIDVANEFSLTGYSVEGKPVGGQSLDVELQVKTLRRPSSDDGFWVGLVDNQGHFWGRADIRPRDAKYNLTSGWSDGETLVVRFNLPLDVGTPPGTYSLVTGIYRLSDLAGLNVLDSNQNPIGQRAKLGQVTVAQASRGTTDTKLAVQANKPAGSGLTLAAYQVQDLKVAPGDSIPVVLLWRSDKSLSAESATLRLASADGHVVTQVEGPIGGRFPTSQWSPGDLVREQRTLKVPATAPSGLSTLSLILPSGPVIPLGTVSISGVARVFTAPQVPHTIQATFGDTIQMVGFGLSADHVAPGGQLAVTVDWKSVRQTSTSYHVFVHLLDSQNHVVAQWDGVPRNWTYPTSAWLPGEYVVDHYTLKLPTNAPTGDDIIEVGLYDATTGKRLSVTGPGIPSSDRVVLQHMPVK